MLLIETAYETRACCHNCTSGHETVTHKVSCQLHPSSDTQLVDHGHELNNAHRVAELSEEGEVVPSGLLADHADALHT